MSEQKEKSIGGFWKKEKNDKKYMSGVIEINGEKSNVVIFQNGYKKEEKHPDYVMYLSKKSGQTLSTQPTTQVTEQAEEMPF